MRNAGTSGAKAIEKCETSKHIIPVPVGIAGVSFYLTGTAKENTAHERVIWRRIRKEVRTVNDKEKYLNALAMLVSMHKRGVISIVDFHKAERYISKKYCIKKGSIYRPNDLINISF